MFKQSTYQSPALREPLTSVSTELCTRYCIPRVKHKFFARKEGPHTTVAIYAFTALNLRDRLDAIMKRWSCAITARSASVPLLHQVESQLAASQPNLQAMYDT